METQVVQGSSESGSESSGVESAARRFAAALAETPAFGAFEEASVRFGADEEPKRHTGRTRPNSARSNRS